MLNGKKILIGTANGVGDIITVTPALRRLKEICPDCKISFLTRDDRKDVIEGLPYVDQVLCIKRGRFLGRFRPLLELISQDIVIFLEWQPQLLLCSWLFRVKERAGIIRQGHFLTNCLTKKVTRDFLHDNKYVPENYAEILSEVLGVPLNGDITRLDVAEGTVQDKKKAIELLKSGGIKPGDKYIALSPFTGFEPRNWNIKTALDFISRVREAYCLPVVVLGPQQEKKVNDSFTEHNLLGETTFLELVEIIRNAECLVTPDSGPMHIAGATGTPVVCLFSKDLPLRWAPRHKSYPIYLGYDCSPCDDDKARACPTVKCMNDITVEMVMRKVEQALKENRVGR